MKARIVCQRRATRSPLLVEFTSPGPVIQGVYQETPFRPVSKAHAFENMRCSFFFTSRKDSSSYFAAVVHRPFEWPMP